MGTYRENPARKLQEPVEMTSSTYNGLVWDVLDRVYGPLKYAEKRLAKHANATPKAARNWLERLNAPSGENLLNLMASCDELADEINRLVAQKKKEREDA